MLPLDPGILLLLDEDNVVTDSFSKFEARRDFCTFAQSASKDVFPSPSLKLALKSSKDCIRAVWSLRFFVGYFTTDCYSPCCINVDVSFNMMHPDRL